MRKIFSIIICLILTSQGFSETVIEDHTPITILTPSLAVRETLKLKLDNGLEAIIISDPETDKSGALLSVRVGSWDDPPKHPGIAHFTEHLLFLGTEKYPEEGGYHRYIRDHGGQANAFTANHITSYMFSVDNDSFSGALDRFSEFFKEPLFNESGVSRELKAIDQEYAKNLENDDWREIFVHKELAKDSHPYHGFNAGNSQTLGNITREEVKEWYETHYSANLMRVMVISNIPMNELRELVTQKFSGIRDTGRVPYQTSDRYTDREMMGNMVVMRPVKDVRVLTIAWELPEKFVEMKLEKPDSIVCHVLGHEGEESLLEQLKREGLADKLACGALDNSTTHRDIYLQVDLTDKGFHKVNVVIERVFQALNNFRNKKMPRYLFDEMQKTQTLKYQYQARKNVFLELMKHGFTIHDEDLKTYPVNTKIVQKYNPKAVEELLEYMTPDHAIYYLKAPEGTTDIALDQIEQWFKVPYTVQSIDEDLLTKWNEALTHPAIDIPAKNPFVPDQLEVIKITDDSHKKNLVPQPEIVCDDEKGIYYYAFDNQFHEPKINWFIEIKTPEVIVGNANNVVLTDMYVKSLEESLKKYSYPADVAGLKYKISRKNNGVGINIFGFNEKAKELLEKILIVMNEGVADLTKFKMHKEMLLREYNNFAKESPLEQDSEILKKTVYKEYTTEKEKSVAIKRVTQKKFKEFVQNIFKETYVQGLFYGNMSQDDVRDVETLVRGIFNARAYDKDMQLKKEVIDFPNQYGPLYLLSKTPMKGNALILAIEYLPFSLKARAAQEVLMQGMSEPFFSELRTKQQTGYIVFNYGQDIERHLFNFFAVQSNSHSTGDLLARFELFIETFLQEMKNERFDITRFEQIKAASIHKLETPAKNIEEMGALLETLAFDYYGDFKWIDKRLQAVKDLTYDEFTQMSLDMLGRDNKRRVAFMMKGQLPDTGILDYNKTRSANEIKRLSTFTPAQYDQ